MEPPLPTVDTTGGGLGGGLGGGGFGGGGLGGLGGGGLGGGGLGGGGTGGLGGGGLGGGGLGGSGGGGLNCWEQDATELLYRLVKVRPPSLLPASTMPAASETSWKLYGLMPRGSCSCTHSPVKLVPPTSVTALEL